MLRAGATQDIIELDDETEAELEAKFLKYKEFLEKQRLSTQQRATTTGNGGGYGNNRSKWGRGQTQQRASAPRISQPRVIQEVEEYKLMQRYQERKAQQRQHESGEGSEESHSQQFERSTEDPPNQITVYLSSYKERNMENQIVAGAARYVDPEHKFNDAWPFDPEPNLTEHRAFLYNVLYLLDDIPSTMDIVVYADNDYVVETINTGRVARWLNEGWGERKHQDLWVPLTKKLSERQGRIRFTYVEPTRYRNYPKLMTARDFAFDACKANLK